MIPSIIIPAYNPPGTLTQLIQSIRKQTSILIIIVDDGSEPAVQISQEYTFVKLLRNHINKGKGYSLIKGIQYAIDHSYTHSITLDADFQHDPVLIPKFLSIDENITIVCGNRDFKGSMPIHRRFSNIITSKIASLICNVQLFDSQCGYRRYRLQDIYSETFIEHGFQFETEVLIKLLRNGLQISHIDISTIYGEESSAIRHLQDTFSFVKLIIRTLLK